MATPNRGGSGGGSPGTDNRQVVEPLVLLHGDDPYLVTAAALRLREQLSADLVSELGLEEFRASRDWEAIARSVATPPFLAIRRLVLVWDPPQITDGSRPGRQPELLGDALRGRLDTTALLVACRTTLPAASPLLHAVRAQGGEIRFLKRPRGLELRRYVADRIRERGLELGRATFARLVEVASQDLARLHQELEKLEIYRTGTEPISEADALLLVSPAPPTELYRLTDALFEAPSQVGERLAELSARAEVPPPLVVGALARVLRDLLSYSDPRDRDRWRKAAPWKEDKLRAHLKRAGEPRLERWLVQLADLDWSIRTGALDAQEGLELQLAKMATELGSRPAT